MKVLFLNSHLHAEHELVQALQANGYAVLLSASADDAWQTLQLHGTSVDLAIVHREELQEGGVRFLAMLKASPSYLDLPVIFSSQVWGDAEFAQHQSTPEGANAYLQWPFTAEELMNLIHAVFNGGEAPQAEMESLSPSPSLDIPTAAPVAFDSQGLDAPAPFVLEDPAAFFGASEKKESSNSSIELEAPEFSVDPNAGFEGLERTAMPIALDLAPTGSPESEVEVPNIQIPDIQGMELSLAEPLDLTPTESEPTRKLERPTSDADPQAAQEMPYLFQKAHGIDPVAVFAQSLGDAVVPGGAAHSPDAETLKRYLLLREQDVAVLSSHLKSAREQLKLMEDSLREERARAAELSHVASEQKRKIDDFEKEKERAVEELQSELAEAKFQLKAKVDKAKLLESQVREAADEMERLKERVRIDIRKIRTREKELENRLEIMKKDSEALIGAREGKIIELKRKLDLLEFNMDLLQDQHAREKDSSAKLRERLTRAAQVVRVAGGLLDSPGGAAQLAAALAAEDKDQGAA